MIRNVFNNSLSKINLQDHFVRQILSTVYGDDNDKRDQKNRCHTYPLEYSPKETSHLMTPK
jgi:hypothetical protein